MGLGFGLDMGLGDAMALEGEAVAAVGVGVDDGDAGDALLELAVEAYGAGDAIVADVIRNNASLPSTISSPYDGALLFFWT